MSWWTELYDDLLADVLLERADPEATARTADFLIARLDLAPGDRVFDQCCGIGSLAIPLAARGLEVVGVDQAAGYIERGLRDAAAAGVRVDLRAGDAFEVTVTPACQAAFNWWTSFGYAESDDDNARMLARAFGSLAPGGRFALDTMNVPGLLRAFQPEVVVRRQTARGELVLLRESELDLAAGVMHKRWSYQLPDGRQVERNSRVRLFMPDRLAALLEAVGFTEVELLGDIGGAPIALDSARCIALARRPA